MRFLPICISVLLPIQTLWHIGHLRFHEAHLDLKPPLKTAFLDVFVAARPCRFYGVDERGC